MFGKEVRKLKEIRTKNKPEAPTKNPSMTYLMKI